MEKNVDKDTNKTHDLSYPSVSLQNKMQESFMKGSNKQSEMNEIKL